MSTLFKDLLNPAFYDKAAHCFQSAWPEFDQASFKRKVFANNWNDLELKQRFRRTSEVLYEVLPPSFEEASQVLVNTSRIIKKNHPGLSLEFMFIPDFYEVYGLEHSDLTLDAFEVITSLSSAEFAIRPFIQQAPQKVMKHLLKWTDHSDEHVRRLASEGCRPRLPWAMALPDFKKDPTLVLEVLQRLKDDPSEYVRKSVANNLNDISKDNPEQMLSIIEKWQGISKETDWVIKHASRTLLKQAHPTALTLFGYASPDQMKIDAFEVNSPIVHFGNSLNFSFNLTNNSNQKQKIRLEYGIDFVKANGKLARKVFKLSEFEMTSGESKSYERAHPIKPITTRKYYPGDHQLALIVNGVEMNLALFVLEME